MFRLPIFSPQLVLGAGLAILALVFAAWLSRPFVRLGFIAAGVPAPRGPRAVADRELLLTIRRADGKAEAAVPLHVWFPETAGAASSTAPVQPALLVYAPGWGGRRNDNVVLAKSLASHGFIVAAIDDINHDPDALDVAPADAASRHAPIDFGSEAARARVLADFDRRLALQAVKVSAVLDALLANPQLLPAAARFDPARIGMFGSSFGGASALEAALVDTRIRAVVNLDGWIRGRALTTPVRAPMMNFNSTRGNPDPKVYNAPDASPTNKLVAVLQNSYERVIARQLAAEPDAVDITIQDADHGDYTDELYAHYRWKQWRPWRPFMIPPARMYEIVDSYLAAFFEAHLNNMPSPLLRNPRPPFPNVDLRLGQNRIPG